MKCNNCGEEDRFKDGRCIGCDAKVHEEGTTLHRGEMIVPKEVAETFRGIDSSTK